MLAAVGRLHRSLRPAERGVLVWMLLLTLGLGVMLASARTGQERALAQMRADVTTCFLSPGRLAAAQVAYCEARFNDPATPANDYRELQARSTAATRRFQELLGEVPALEERVAELERELERQPR